MANPLLPRLDLSLRYIKRSRQILGVLLAHGFADLLVEAGIAGLLRERLGIRIPLPINQKTPPISRSERLRMVCEDLGPTFIKIGQVLSTRSDLLPPQYCQELKKLQSHCPCIPFSAIQMVLREELGELLDSEFQTICETPLASASLAQTHRATLKDGREIVLKVQKPDTVELLRADFGILKELALLIENHFDALGFSMVAVHQEFSDEIMREIDYRREAHSTEKLRKMFLHNPEVKFPTVFPRLSTAKVLALEYIEGQLVSDLQLPLPDRKLGRKVVRAMTRAVFQQCLENGFFHADPHPGNIILLPQGSICFIDCGMTGHLDQRTTTDLAELCHAIISSDADGAALALLKITDADPRLAENRAFRADIRKVVAQLQSSTLENLHIGTILGDFFDLLRDQHINCPADLVLLLKALSTIETVAAQIDPDFNAPNFVRPYLTRLIRRRYGVKAIYSRVGRTMIEYLELAEHLPQHIDSLFDRFLSERFHVHLEHKGLNTLTKNIAYLSNQLSKALIVSALLVGSSILVLADRVSDQSGTATLIGSIGFGTAFLLACYLLFSSHK